MPKGGTRVVRTNTSAKPVSGPGKLSQRTDMIPSNPNVYGDRTAMQEQMAGAEMAGGTVTPKLPQAPAPKTKMAGLFDPTQRPDEPVTAGVPIGPGNSPKPVYAGKYDMINQYMTEIERLAAGPDAPETFKAFANYVKVASQQQ